MEQQDQALEGSGTGLEGVEEDGSVITVPECASWTVEEVADWVERVGFKQYRVSSRMLH